MMVDAVADFRFPRRVRLLRSADYQRVFERSVRSADACFTVLARTRTSIDARRANEPPLCARLGLAISRKSARRAVDRNRLKRFVRESFRHARDDLVGLDLVVMCRSAAVGADATTLQQSLTRHWGQLRQRPCVNI